MEEFLTVRRTKNTETQFAPGKLTCFYGRTGIGKTWYVTRHLSNPVWLDHDILRSKQTTLDFLERLRWTETPVVIDNWESVQDLIGVREIHGPLSKGPTVIVSHEPVDIPGVVLVQAPVLSVDDMLRIAHSTDRALAESCQGDLRAFLARVIHHSDAKDQFETPLEFVQVMLSHPRPIEYIHRAVHEHGYTLGVIQENYTDARRITIEECASIAESLSLADVYDETIYKEGAWDTLMPYFVESGCVRPAVILASRLGAKKLRSGSVWSKFQNICMRLKKIDSTRLDRDALTVIRKYIECEDFSILKDYPLDPSAIDILNHLGTPKLRPKLVDQAKKLLREK